MYIGMGTSEAVGNLEKAQNVLGWINALAFLPADLQAGVMQDEWLIDAGSSLRMQSSSWQPGRALSSLPKIG